jgi:hypothetical protein
MRSTILKDGPARQPICPWGVVALGGDLALGVHGDMFCLPRPQLNVIHDCGMGLTKFALGLFFFMPWVAVPIAQIAKTAGLSRPTVYSLLREAHGNGG